MLSQSEWKVEGAQPHNSDCEMWNTTQHRATINNKNKFPKAYVNSDCWNNINQYTAEMSHTDVHEYADSSAV